MMNEDQLGEFIDQHFTRDLFRLETRERYNVESDGEDLRRYLRGESNPAAPGKAECSSMSVRRPAPASSRGG